MLGSMNPDPDSKSSAESLEAGVRQMHGIPRRTVLKNISLLGAAGFAPRVQAAEGNAIVAENAKPGTQDWMLTKTAVDPATKYRCPSIEGFCSKTSAKAGETISFHVSTKPASPFSLDIYRIGYYAVMAGG